MLCHLHCCLRFLCAASNAPAALLFVVFASIALEICDTPTQLNFVGFYPQQPAPWLLLLCCLETTWATQQCCCRWATQQCCCRWATASWRCWLLCLFQELMGQAAVLLLLGYGRRHA
jgi:hypothetical protein